MNLWLWTFAMTFWTMWYEPFNMNLLMWSVGYDIWPSVWYLSRFPSYEGNMAVLLMHQWHDSSVVEWCATPSLSVSVMRARLLYDYDLSAGAYGCILNLFLYLLWCYHTIYLSGDWCWVQSTSFTFLGVDHSIWLLRTPLILSGYLRGLPFIWLWRLMVTLDMILSDLFWARGGFLTYLSLHLYIWLYLMILPIAPYLFLFHYHYFACISVHWAF